MRHKINIFCIAVSIWLVFSAGDAFSQPLSAGKGNGKCRTVSAGVEYCLVKTSLPPDVSDARIHFVRIDPSIVRLRLLLASEQGGKSRTPSAWGREFGLIAAINAGMYAQDYSTNVGYLKNGQNIQNKRWVKSYKSVLAFDPRSTKSPPAVIADLDDPDAVSRLQDYNVVIQNLRLMKGSGVNVWKKTDKRWSEAAVGIDKGGRLLFIFCGSPFNMWEFNELVRATGMGVERMMHMEGGAVAGMSVRTGEVSLDLAGNGETGIKPDRGNNRQWAIPNVIGVQAR